MRNKLCASSSAAMLATFSLVVLLYDHENEINIEILKRKDVRLTYYCLSPFIVFIATQYILY